jgi:hypothetical protein
MREFMRAVRVQWLLWWIFGVKIMIALQIGFGPTPEFFVILMAL